MQNVEHHGLNHWTFLVEEGTGFRNQLSDMTKEVHPDNVRFEASTALSG